MYEYVKTWLELKTDKRAVTALEYALIAGVMCVVVLAGMGLIKPLLAAKFTAISNTLT